MFYYPMINAHCAVLFKNYVFFNNYYFITILYKPNAYSVLTITYTGKRVYFKCFLSNDKKFNYFSQRIKYC